MKDENKTKRELINELARVRQQRQEYADMLDVIPDIVYKVDSEGDIGTRLRRFYTEALYYKGVV